MVARRPAGAPFSTGGQFATAPSADSIVGLHTGSAARHAFPENDVEIHLQHWDQHDILQDGDTIAISLADVLAAETPDGRRALLEDAAHGDGSYLYEAAMAAGLFNHDGPWTIDALDEVAGYVVSVAHLVNTEPVTPVSTPPSENAVLRALLGKVSFLDEPAKAVLLERLGADPRPPVTGPDPLLTSGPASGTDWVGVSEHDEISFTSRACHVLARELSSRTGWPVVVVGAHPTDSSVGWVHAGVRHPDGSIIDVRGVHEEPDWLDDWAEHADEARVDGGDDDVTILDADELGWAKTSDQDKVSQPAARRVTDLIVHQLGERAGARNGPQFANLTASEE